MSKFLGHGILSNFNSIVVLRRSPPTKMTKTLQNVTKNIQVFVGNFVLEERVDLEIKLGEDKTAGR